MSYGIKVERRDGIVLVSICAPPVNALSAAVRTGLLEALRNADGDSEVRGVVIGGAGTCFSAGADIAEFRTPSGGSMFSGCDPAEITAFIDRMKKPVVAAIHGAALGGGLELALGCHYRVASPDAKLGLPEISLGLLPGAGGTQRLTRLIGVEPALKMMLSGDAVNASEALVSGLIDKIADIDVVEASIGQIRLATEHGGRPRRARDKIAVFSDETAGALDLARKASAKRRAHAKAARAIICCVEAAGNARFDEAIRLEREQFIDCNASHEAAALQHAFFAQRDAARFEGNPPGTRARRVELVGVVGGGTMGRGIAMSFVNAGFPVTILETTQDRADAALKAIHGEYDRLKGGGHLSGEAATKRSALVSATVQEAALCSRDLVIEAVFEDFELKAEVCRRLGEICKPGAIIASNTSTLDINALARASGRPRDFLGMHFFSPAHLMKLLEVVRGGDTAPEVLLTVMQLAKRLEKHPVITGVCYGFIGNRMLEPYLRETEALLLEGATPRMIDGALEEFGMAMGPCRMMDLAGIDVVASVVAERAKAGALPRDPQYRIVCRELARIGRYGQKTAEGFYRYNGRNVIDDVDTVSLVKALANRNAVPQRSDIGAEEIVERCLLPLINEGFRIAEEGIASRQSDIDVVWLSGYGFPRERGGPMFHAESLGPGRIVARLLHYGATRNDPDSYWRPAESVSELAKSNETTGAHA